MATKNSASDLLNYENTGTLEVQALTMSGTTLSPTTPGTVDASTMVVTDSNKDISGFRHITLTGNLVSGSTTISETDIAKIDAITNGTVASGKAVVPTTGNVVDDLSITAIRTGYADKTAGTTQTQAGATAITSTITGATVGNANDGLVLPAMTAGRVLFINNLSANAGKVYGSGDETINGTAGSSGSVALTASGFAVVYATAAGVSILKNLI
jgi:hypothetical protein